MLKFAVDQEKVVKDLDTFIEIGLLQKVALMVEMEVEAGI
jgi:hypothetical protein